MANLEQVFKDWQGRRAGLIKALTTKSDDFYEQCDPEKPNLCLYGKPNEQWEVSLPDMCLPPELPDPILGINFARDGMKKEDWLKLVSVHSDAWLLSVAFYSSSCFGFDRAERALLFDMVNELPTLFEVVAGQTIYAKHSNKKPNLNSNSNSKLATPQDEEEEEEEGLEDKVEVEEEEEEEEEEDEDTICEDCGKIDKSNELWICCDICETWFHAKCVKTTRAIAEHIKQYTYPCCSNKIAPNKIENIHQDLPWHQRAMSCWKLFAKCLFN